MLSGELINIDATGNRVTTIIERKPRFPSEISNVES